MNDFIEQFIEAYLILISYHNLSISSFIVFTKICAQSFYTLILRQQYFKINKMSCQVHRTGTDCYLSPEMEALNLILVSNSETIQIILEIYILLILDEFQNWEIVSCITLWISDGH